MENQNLNSNTHKKLSTDQILFNFQNQSRQTPRRGEQSGPPTTGEVSPLWRGVRDFDVDDGFWGRGGVELAFASPFTSHYAHAASALAEGARVPLLAVNPTGRRAAQAQAAEA